jgi:hypothetical protein
MGQMPYQAWERDVFPDFSKQIRENIPEDVHAGITQGVSAVSILLDLFCIL